LKKKTIKTFFRGEKIFNIFLMLFGFVFAIIGTWISLSGDH